MTMTGETDMSLMLIAYKMANNYGLAEKKWRLTLHQIRSLPEP